MDEGGWGRSSDSAPTLHVEIGSAAAARAGMARGAAASGQLGAKPSQQARPHDRTEGRVQGRVFRIRASHRCSIRQSVRVRWCSGHWSARRHAQGRDAVNTRTVASRAHTHVDSSNASSPSKVRPHVSHVMMSLDWVAKTMFGCFS